MLRKIIKRIHEGKYINLVEPTKEEDLECLRCGGSTGHAFHEKDCYSWFCLDKNCLQLDAAISKEIVKKNAMMKLQEERQQAEKIRKSKIIDTEQDKKRSKQKYNFWYNDM